MNTYQGRRDAIGVIVTCNGKFLCDLESERNPGYSDNEFDWGPGSYVNSHLAWGILRGEMDEWMARAWLPSFTVKVVERLPLDGWILTSADVANFVITECKAELEKHGFQRHCPDAPIPPIEPPVDIWEELEDGGEQALGM